MVLFYNWGMVIYCLQFFDFIIEQGVLCLLIVVLLLLVVVVVVFGLLVNFLLIIFDGIYGLIDVVMIWLLLLVVWLIVFLISIDVLQLWFNQCFIMGFWYLELIVLGVSGMLMIGVVLYVLVNVVDVLMFGGCYIVLGLVIVFVGLFIVGEGVLVGFILCVNCCIGLEFIVLDVKNWVIVVSMLVCYLLVFFGGVLVQGILLVWVGLYIDLVIFVFVCVLVMIVLFGIVCWVLVGILLVILLELQVYVDVVVCGIVVRYGFVEYCSYVVQVGCGEQIELFFVVCEDDLSWLLVEWDWLCDEIGDVLGEVLFDWWLIIMFIIDCEWMIQVGRMID